MNEIAIPLRDAAAAPVRARRFVLLCSSIQFPLQLRDLLLQSRQLCCCGLAGRRLLRRRRDFGRLGHELLAQ